MLYVVMFEDSPNLGDSVRQLHMPDHLAFLERCADQIVAARPLLGKDGRPDGGLWLVTAASEQEVDALVKADPFGPTGLRAGYHVRAWRQVFAQRRRLV